MLYEVTIKGKTKKIYLEKVEGDYYKASEEKNVSRILIHSRERDRILLSVNDKMYSVRQLRRTSSSVEFIADGELVHAQLGKAAKGGAPEMYTSVASVSEIVTSNFPAKVVQVAASKGSTLEEGEILIVLEAMKMEAQIKTPKKCRILEVYVKAGDMIERGRKLARLEFLATS